MPKYISKLHRPMKTKLGRTSFSITILSPPFKIQWKYHCFITNKNVIIKYIIINLTKQSQTKKTSYIIYIRRWHFTFNWRITTVWTLVWFFNVKTFERINLCRFNKNKKTLFCHFHFICHEFRITASITAG